MTVRRGSSTSRVRQALAGAVAALGLLGLFHGVAEAHVFISNFTTTPDGLSTVTFSFQHGCGPRQQLPTTSLKIKLPDGTGDIAPQAAPAGYSPSVNGTEVSWTGPPIPDKQKVDFVATMRLPGQTGETVFLPTVQGCEGGEDLWLEKSTDPEAPNAAPRVVLTQTVAPASTTTAAPSTVAPTTTAAPPRTAVSSTGTTPGSAPPTTPVSSTSSGNPGAIVFFVVTAIIVVGAAVIILRRPNRPGRASPDGSGASGAGSDE